MIQRRHVLAGGAAATLLRPGGAGAQTSGAQGAQPTPQRGGTLRMFLRPEPATLNLAANQQTPVQMVACHIYQGLLTYDFDLKPQPGLAREWEVAPDGMAYTFRLHDGITWHDGRPFTPEDVIFNVTELLPAVHTRARLVFGHVDSVTAPDARTIVFRMKEPFPAFIQALEVVSAPMLPKHLYAGTDYATNPANLAPVGTGPFRFVEWKRGEYVRLERFDKYHIQGRPYLDAIVQSVVPGAQSRIIALRQGQADLASWVDVDYVLLPQVASDPNLTVTTKGYEYSSPITWLEMNNRVKPLDDKRVRRAIWQALDRGFIVRAIFNNTCKVATGPLATTTPFYDASLPKIPYDPKAAEALLDEAGLKRGADGKRFQMKLLPLPYGDTWQRLAEYCRQALEKIGIGITMEATDAGGWAQRVSNWEYELTINILSQYADPALGVARCYVSSNIRKGIYAANNEGYANPRVDELFARAAVEVDRAKRGQMYAEIQRILVEDVPVAWIAEMSYPTIMSRKLHDVVVNSNGTIDTFENAWIER